MSDELIRRLRKKAAASSVLGEKYSAKLFGEAADLIEQQASRITELDKDAARYRWLRDQVTIDPEECYYAMPEVFAWDIKPGPQLNKLFPNFDAAIDAALSAQPAKD